jgi:hypothetical protein
MVLEQWCQVFLQLFYVTFEISELMEQPEQQLYVRVVYEQFALAFLQYHPLLHLFEEVLQGMCDALVWMILQK